MRSTERVTGSARAGIAALALSGAVASAAPAGGPMPAAVARIERGQWEVKTIGSDAAPRALCVTDPMVLFRYGHAGPQCRRRLVADTADLATIDFVCPGTGHGRTTLKVATPRAFNLDTQGIVDGAPFDDRYEAHRIGECGGAAPR